MFSNLQHRRYIPFTNHILIISLDIKWLFGCVSAVKALYMDAAAKFVEEGHDTTARPAAQATGRKKTAAKEKNKKSDSAESVGQGLVLVGDIGFEKYKTASGYLKAKKQSNHGRFSEASVGFGNLSAIAIILEQQQDEQGKL